MIECGEDVHPIRDNTIIPSSRNAATADSNAELVTAGNQRQVLALTKP